MHLHFSLLFYQEVLNDYQHTFHLLSYFNVLHVFKFAHSTALYHNLSSDSFLDASVFIFPYYKQESQTFLPW